MLLCASQAQAEDARQVYAHAADRVYQILIIDQQSKEKAAIGSGFVLSTEQLLATNFHVIANAVHEPEKFRIEAKNRAGVTHTVSVADFDVIHDLAILRFVDEIELPAPLEISQTVPTQGEEIYALGNPYDLGHTIIPGTYNGLLEQSFYQKLHFSGSLNPGMSGGPAINEKSELVGVNVATSGNQISFLVPIRFLTELLANYQARGAALAEENYLSVIADQLYADQNYKFSLLLEHDWQTQTLGSRLIGADINDYFKCWGNTNDDAEEFQQSSKTCTSQDNIYVSPTFTTGAIDIQYAWLSTTEFDSYRFHKVFGRTFSRMSTRTWAGEDDVTNYQCNRDFVTQPQLSPSVWRAVMCVRQYKKFPRLYDVLYSGSLLGKADSGLASHFALSGVSHENAMAFARKFMELHAWES
ncbi:MAG: serine protease [Pseudomonadales bacterium]